MQYELDKNIRNSRQLLPLDRQFFNKKVELEKLLKDLYVLVESDDLMPLISKLYDTAN